MGDDNNIDFCCSRLAINMSEKGFPDKTARQVCWDGRDAFWSCMDKHEDKAKCQKELQLFEKSCSKTWFKYFLRRRDFLKYKERLAAGENIPPPGTNSEG